MKQKMNSLGLVMLCLVLSILDCAYAQDRRPSYPLITGDGFRHSADFIYDDTEEKFSPADVRTGDRIFVKDSCVEHFFYWAHPKIAHPYVLITHNGDQPAPPGSSGNMLDDEKILVWFGQNVQGSHKKLIPIPIGLENRYNSNGNPEVVLEAIKQLETKEKPWLLYMNFDRNTYSSERSRVFNMFKDALYCISGFRKGYKDFLKDLSQSKFVLCPRGNGLDTHRTWETLLMGSIPIVKSSAMDAAFDDLPVVIVQDWSEINEEFLWQKYNELSKSSYNLDKLYMPYWLDYIKNYAP